MIKICKYCGKEFEGTGTSLYCPGPHFSVCEICGKEFEIDVRNPKRCCSRKCSSELRKRTIISEHKICEICGEYFYPESNTQRYCKNEHYRSCPVCREPVLIKNASEPPRTCSTECANKLRESTCIDNFGTKIASQSEFVKSRLREAYINSKDKREKTCISRWGVHNPSMSNEVKHKISNSILSSECRTKTKATMNDRYGADYAMQNKHLRQKQSRNIKNRSSLEIRLHNFLNQYNIDHIVEHSIKKDNNIHSFDVYLPKYKILIDCDGTYYHSYLSDPDGIRVRDDYDDVRLSLIPDDHIFILIVESDFERGLNNIKRTIENIDSNIFDYDSEIFKWCRSIEFPYPKYSEDRLNKEWTRLKNLNIDKYNPFNKIGISILNHFHKSIWDCKVGNCLSPKSAWYDDNKLKKVIANRLIYQNDVDPSKILQGFSISKIAPKVSIFNPVTAKYLIQKYLSDSQNIVDPFSGFSGRMLGVVASGKHYIGSDIRQNAVNESNEIISFLNISDASKVTQSDILSRSINTSGDALFTCPPYGMKETYLDNQSNLTCDDWIDICLSKYDCEKYLFVVDNTTKYAQNIVEDLPVASHFRNNSEYVILINNNNYEKINL